MKDFLSSLFNTKIKRIVRVIELVLILLSVIFFIYEKKTPIGLHFEGDDFTLERYNDNNCYILRDLSLGRGIYRFNITALSSEEGATARIESAKLAGMRLNSGAAFLPTTSLSSYIRTDLKGSADDITVVITPAESGIFEISSLDVIKTTDLAKRNFIIVLFLIVLAEVMLHFLVMDIKGRKTAFLLTAISLICCYPLFSDYLMESHDILFHLARIEGLAKGLENGAFPVKIQPFWGNDYGYAVGVFYGDILLYFPAFLRLMGFSLQAAFQIYTAFIQFATVAISFFSFKKMFGKEDTALFGTALYAFSIYRLQNTYTRAAIGEFTAMAFLPLVLCGFYLVLSDRKGKTYTERFKACAITALGLTGLVGSHILSCEMIAFFIIISLLVCIKRVFTKKTFQDLLSALAMTLVLNIGFLVPFLDFYFQPLYIRSASWSGGSSTGIQEYGLSFLQLFVAFGRSTGGSFATTSGVSREVSFSVGIVLLLLLAVFFFLLVTAKETITARTNFKPALFMAVIGSIALFMSTSYFPWNSLASTSKGLKNIIATIQFPWRFVGFATVALVFTACFVYEYIKDSLSKEVFTAFVSIVLTLMFATSAWYLNDLAMNSEPYRVYDSYEAVDSAFYSAEYLYEGTDIKAFMPNCLVSNNVDINNYSKKGTSITASLVSSSEGYVEFPLNYYKHYVCKASDGSNLNVEAGSNNCVKINVPAAFSKDIQLFFKEPLYWRLSEVISAISFIALIGYLFVISQKQKTV